MKKELDLYVGTYSRNVLFGDGTIFEGKGEGIYHLGLNMENGALSLLSATDTDNPSYVTVNKDKTMLYAVNELEEYEGEKSGTVSCFRIGDKALSFVNRKLTRGLDPCHVALTPDEKFLCVSNYGTGSFGVFGISDGGSIGDMVQFMEHSGRGKDPKRQSGPHCHSVSFSPKGRFAYVMELGCDEIYSYELSKAALKDEAPFVSTEQGKYLCDPGDGPRFLCFDRRGDYAYVVNELSNSVSVFSCDPHTGRLVLIQKISSLPEESKDCPNTLADLHFSENGRYLYGTNRGHDSIVCFETDPVSGKLSAGKWIPCKGRTPRNFAVDERGQYLICANQDSDNLVVFRMDQQNGRLEPACGLSIGSPVCVKIV